MMLLINFAAGRWVVTKIPKQERAFSFLSISIQQVAKPNMA
jgi:hypothetical protein